MSIATTCPNKECRSSLHMPDRMVGKQVQCPKCKQPFLAYPGSGKSLRREVPTSYLALFLGKLLYWRRLILGGIAVAVLIVGGVYLANVLSAPPLALKNYDKLKPGLSADEVRELVGPPEEGAFTAVKKVIDSELKPPSPIPHPAFAKKAIVPDLALAKLTESKDTVWYGPYRTEEALPYCFLRLDFHDDKLVRASKISFQFPP